MPGTRLRLFVLGAVTLAQGSWGATAGPSRGQEETMLIDDCRYPDDAAAQAAWLPMGETAPARVAQVEGRHVLWLRCNFADTSLERASWDRQVQLNLADCQGIRFKFWCRDTGPVSSFSLYFQSGDGWYHGHFFPSQAGWNTITLDKSTFGTEGRPAGWGQIQTIRLSAWRGGDTDTEFYLRDWGVFGVLGKDVSIAIVRADSAAEARPAEMRSIHQYAEAVAQTLAAAGLGAITLSDQDVTAERLEQVKLVVLPHNPVLPDRLVQDLRTYLNAGGKLLAFYGLHPELRPVVKIGGGTYVPQKYPGYFAAMRFAPGVLPGAPAVVGQRSWNIVTTEPLAGESRVLAEWLDEAGQPTGYAAIVGSANCVAVSHVLLSDDPANKQRMLRALVGHLVPELWSQAADASLARIGQIAGLGDFAEATAQIASMSQGDRQVRGLLATARRLRHAATRLRAAGRFPEACERAAEAAQRVLEAYSAAQKPLPGEFRAFWCHSAFGVEGMDWEAAVKRLADHGFQAILPNMLWGGVAFYPSKVLPVAPEVATRGDQIAQCVAAGQKYGVQVHVWKVNWNLGAAPPEFIAQMRREGRLQANSRGEELLWLCPSHPDNQRLEVESMLEVVRHYPVDGLHFDYIRYPDGDHCFCPGCKERFQAAMGLTTLNFPQDVLAGGALRSDWLEWRRRNITAVVKAVSEQARAIKPTLRISAAVFRNWSVDRDVVGQDWKLWCEQGYLDFVCPMDYTDSDMQLENWVKLQKGWAGSTPVYPGIGAWALPPDRVIGQIAITRRYQTGGFVLFNYGVAEAQELLPMLGRGMTAKR